MRILHEHLTTRAFVPPVFTVPAWSCSEEIHKFPPQKLTGSGEERQLPVCHAWEYCEGEGWGRLILEVGITVAGSIQGSGRGGDIKGQFLGHTKEPRLGAA